MLQGGVTPGYCPPSCPYPVLSDGSRGYSLSIFHSYQMGPQDRVLERKGAMLGKSPLVPDCWCTFLLGRPGQRADFSFPGSLLRDVCARRKLAEAEERLLHTEQTPIDQKRSRSSQLSIPLLFYSPPHVQFSLMSSLWASL